MSKRLVLSVLGTLALVACEPIDGGGGGGVGGRLAFVRDGALFLSQDDGNGERTITDPQTSADPATSPNGQSVAFAYSATGDADARGIWRIGTADGSQLEQVAAPPSGQTFSAPAWSPDGTTLVFVATDGTDSTLLRVDASGGTPTAIDGVADVNFPAFIDANTLLVLHGAGLELKTLDLSTGALTALGVSTRSRGAVSRDGTRIAFAEESSGRSVIVVRTLATGTDTAIASSGQGDLKPTFSPEGSFVAFEAKGLIYAAPSDGTGTAEVLQSGTDVAWGF